MPRLHAVLFGSAAMLVLASAAHAATPQWHTTTVDLPDGSKAEIEYVGDIPPRVRVSMPVVQQTHLPARDEVTDQMIREEEVAYGGLPRARRVVQARPIITPAPVAQEPLPPQFVVAGDMPKGTTYEYTLITTGTDGRVCSQRTEWKSRGRNKEPEVRRTDRGEGCAAMSSPRPLPEARQYEASPVDVPPGLDGIY